MSEGLTAFQRALETTTSTQPTGLEPVETTPAKSGLEQFAAAFAPAVDKPAVPEDEVVYYRSPEAKQLDLSTNFDPKSVKHLTAKQTGISLLEWTKGVQFIAKRPADLMSMAEQENTPAGFKRFVRHLRNLQGA